MLERIDIKLPLKVLPVEYAPYVMWRFKMKQRIRSCGLPGSIVTPFLVEMERKTLLELKVSFGLGLEI